MNARINNISSTIEESSTHTHRQALKIVLSSAISRIGQSRFKLRADSSLAPEFVDCSSYVQWAFHQGGVILPRLSYQQAEHGNNVSRETILPGDLIFTTSPAFNWELPCGLLVGHVCIYTESGMITHATSDHRYVATETIETLCVRRQITCIKRIIE